MPLLRPSPSASASRASRLGLFSALAGTTGLLFASAPALADPSPALDRFSFSVGAFNADPKINASVGTQYGAIKTGDIKPGRVTMPRVNADLLLGDHSGISFDYYRYNRDYSGGFGNSFGAGPLGTISTAGNANLNTQLDFAKLSYKYWFGSGNTVLGLGAGAAYYRVKLGVSAYAGVNGLVGTYSDSTSSDAYAPLLEIGVRHAISPDLRLFADASGVWKNGGRFHGNLYNAQAGVEWFPIKNVGVVLAYQVTNIDLTRDATGFSTDTRLKLKMQGPTAFLKARF